MERERIVKAFADEIVELIDCEDGLQELVEEEYGYGSEFASKTDPDDDGGFFDQLRSIKVDAVLEVLRRFAMEAQETE